MINLERHYCFGRFGWVANDMTGAKRHSIDTHTRDTLYMYEMGDTQFYALKKSRNLYL